MSGYSNGLMGFFVNGTSGGGGGSFTLTTNGNTGVATFISNVLNIPNYSSVAYLPLEGGTMVGSILFTDNTYDIGASGATRPRTAYFGTSVVNPLLIGGSATTSSLTYRATTGVGTTNADHIFQVGNNGAKEAMRILNNGFVGIGTPAPNFELDIQGQIRLRPITAYGVNTGKGISLRYDTVTGHDFGYLVSYDWDSSAYKEFRFDSLRTIFNTGNVLIGTTTDAGSLLQVNGSASILSLQLACVAKTANYTITTLDYTVNCTANSFTVTLPTAIGHTRIHNIKNSGTGTITVNTTSSQLIDGLLIQTVATLANLQIQSNGANWIIL